MTGGEKAIIVHPVAHRCVIYVIAIKRSVDLDRIDGRQMYGQCHCIILVKNSLWKIQAVVGNETAAIHGRPHRRRMQDKSSSQIVAFKLCCVTPERTHHAAGNGLVVIHHHIGPMPTGSVDTQRQRLGAQAVVSVKKHHILSAGLTDGPVASAPCLTFMRESMIRMRGSDAARRSSTARLPSVEASLKHISSQSVKVWAITDPTEQSRYRSALYTGIITETKGIYLHLCCNMNIIFPFPYTPQSYAKAAKPTVNVTVFCNFVPDFCYTVNIRHLRYGINQAYIQNRLWPLEQPHHGPAQSRAEISCRQSRRYIAPCHPLRLARSHRQGHLTDKAILDTLTP